MRCTSPKYLYFSLDAKGSPVGAPRKPDGSGDYVPMPCGGCTPCVVNHSRDISNCIELEARFSKFCCSGTATFDDEHLPDSFDGVAKLIAKMKRQMKKAAFNPRSYWIIERGGKTDRLHNHFVFFHEDFRDGGIESISGTKYLSNVFLKFWPYGNYELDTVSPASCSYAAGHQAGKPLIPRWREDGSENWRRIPATKPAMGMTAARKFYSDMNVLGALVRGGGLTAIPRKFLRNEPDLFAGAIEKRREFAAKCMATSETVDQMEAREYSARRRVEQAYEEKAFMSPKPPKIKSNR